ncbi:MAG: TonB-dependent receptor, partial [Bacteroidota bacterium]
RRDTYVMNPTNITPQPYFINNAWNQPGDVTYIWIARNLPHNLRETNSYFIEDGSFIRLRNVKLSYRISQELSSKLHVKNLSAYVYGSNLLTWTNYLWFDPEISINNPLQMGQDGGAYPKKRELGVGINIGF